jgi:DNA invertase Pin-like site-specific DNA recombinase
MQLSELREYCHRRDWKIAGEYVDTGWSGAKRSRPELDRLMADARQHKIDCIVVWKLDRFGRSVANLVDALQQLQCWGVRFLATTQSIDTDQANPTSQLMLHILAAVAEFERELIRERVKAGLVAAKARGTRLGRHPAVIDRLRVQELSEAGLSVRAIAGRLKASRSVVGRLLVSRKRI